MSRRRKFVPTKLESRSRIPRSMVSSQPRRNVLPVVRRVASFCIEAIFPASCYGCGAADSYLCERCLGIVGALPEPRCPHCATRLPFGELPNACRAAIHASRFFCCADYHTPSIRNAIHDFKYAGAFALAPDLARYIRAWIFRRGYAELFADPTILVVPVPSHPKRQRERGFHPAAKLAESFAQQMNLAYCGDALMKTKNNPPQVETKSADQRRENVKGVFILHKPQLVRGRTVLIVDDVCTTGATITECARAIRDGKPKKIWALTVAKD